MPHSRLVQRSGQSLTHGHAQWPRAAMSGRVCPKGPVSFVSSFFELLGMIPRVMRLYCRLGVDCYRAAVFTVVYPPDPECYRHGRGALTSISNYDTKPNTPPNALTTLRHNIPRHDTLLQQTTLHSTILHVITRHSRPLPTTPDHSPPLPLGCLPPSSCNLPLAALCHKGRA